MSKHPLNDPMIEQVSKVFGALSDGSRLKILRALLEARKPLSQGTVAELTELSQANASKHLGYLLRAGLVTRDPQGNTVYFSPVEPLTSELCDLVCGHVSERIRSAYQILK